MGRSALRMYKSSLDSYWNFSTSSVEVEDICDPFLRILMREKTRSVAGDKWCDYYNCQFNRNRLSAQTVAESRLDDAIKSGDNGGEAIGIFFFDYVFF